MRHRTSGAGCLRHRVKAAVSKQLELQECRSAAGPGAHRRLSGTLLVLAAASGLLVAHATSGAGVTAVAGGREHTCALTKHGSVQCWGRNVSGQLGDGTTTDRLTPVTVSGLESGVVAVSASYAHTCALTSGGAVRCWGQNAYGQLGDGTTTDRSAPVAVSGLGSGVVAIATGSWHTCALTSGGAVLCWGINTFGQLGDGTTTTRFVPVAVSGLGSGVVAVAAGPGHTCAITSAGAAQCWGLNAYGQLGDGTTANRSTAVTVSGLGSGVVAVGTGGYSSCAVTGGGAVQCWGYNAFGQLGDGTTTQRLTPVAVSGLGTGVVAVTVGDEHACALTSGGAAHCWGWNGSSQLGDGTTTDRWTPVTVSGLSSGAQAVAAGAFHTCAVTSGGASQCWGFNLYGEIGDGTTTDRSTPVTVIGLAGGEATVATGLSHSCALTSGGVQCWGSNVLGQLGDGTTTNHVMPGAVSGLASGVVAVSAGDGHTCALTVGGGVQCWGANYYGQLGDGTTTDRYIPVTVTGLASGVVAVSAGSMHTCALTGSGALFCWGYNNAGQLGNGTYAPRLTPTAVTGLGSGVVAVSAGSSHTCAVTSAGGVQCWGRNWSGQLGDGTTADQTTPVAVTALGSRVATVSAGNAHTCALTIGGGVLCWGANSTGALGDGTTTNRLTPVAVTGLASGAMAVSAGWAYSCAATTAGELRCWGGNISGQLGDGSTANRSTPATVTGLATGVVAAAAGPYHACALTVAGALSCWGANYYGQLGDGTTTNRLTPVVAGIHRPSQDVDGNGTSDVVWRHTTGGDVWLWRMAGVTVSSQNLLGVVGDTGWAIRGRGDQTGDGKADLLWRHATSGMIYLWTMNGATVTAVTYVGAVDPAFDIVGVGDYGGAGRTDILWRHTTSGELWLWVMDGATIQSVTRVATIDPAFAVVASGDMNADGKADIIWRHATTGDVWIWLMNGATPMSQVYVGTVADLGYEVAGLGDHTGDGKSDLLWRHATTGDVWLWTMDGTAVTSVAHVASVTDTGYRIVGNGDYDGDGMADVLWRHATSGDVWMWLMDGATIRSATWISTVADVGYRVQAGR